MSKIIKICLILILAFFIYETSVSQPLNAQDTLTLENGLRIAVKEDHRNPIVVFSVFIDVGSASEGEYLGSGVSHLIEHMLFKGTKRYKPGAIENILHIYGGHIEGLTSYDYTGFRITILKEHKEVALDILKEMLTSPLFNRQEIKKEKQVIEREMDLSKDDPGQRISRLTFSNAYLRHPYRVPIIGYKENFKRLDRANLVKFFDSNYTAERIVMAVAGDIDREAMLADLKNVLGEIPRGGNAYVLRPEEPEQIAERDVEEKIGIEGAYLNIAFHSTGILDKDLYALDILSFILGEGEGSRLNERVRKKKQLVLSVSASNYTPKDPGLFVISSTLKDENINKAIEGIVKEIEDLKENGVSEEELTKAKNNFIAGYLYQKETIESQANDLALGLLLAGDPRFFEKYLENIKTVTSEDVQKAARKYLTKNNMTIVVLTKSGNALEVASEEALQKNKREIHRFKLENGLPVLVCEDRSLPISSISFLLKGGLRFERKEDNGISQLLSLMFMDGTSSMTREEIADFYESRGMAADRYSGSNSLGISVTCLKENIEDALRLTSELCFKSVFPEEELEREKKELLSAILMQDNQIFNHGHRLLKEQLFKQHPYRFQTIGTRESISKIGRRELMDFYERVASADNMVLGISGDSSIDSIEPMVKKYFAGIPARKKDSSLPEKEPSINRTRELLVNTDKDQSLLLFGFHGTDVYSKERYAVEVMMEILSSESGILFEKIREKGALSYATGAFQVLGIDPGYLVIYALTSKENIAKTREIIFKEISSFIKTGASPEDIQKAKNHLKAMRQMELETNSSFIFTASMDELYGLGYDNYKTYDKNIDAVTREDLRNAAPKFLTLDKCAVVILEGR